MSDPRDIFSVEVWNIILHFVEDPQDILSCSRTCTLFANSLSPTQSTWAFPLILPSLIKFLPRSDVLQCRLVSKDWLKSVDNFLQSDNFAPTLVHQLKSHKQNLSSSLLTRISSSNQLHRNNLGVGFIRGIQVPQGIALVDGFINAQYRDNFLRLNQIGDLLAREIPNRKNVDDRVRGWGLAQNLALGLHLPVFPYVRRDQPPEIQDPDRNEFLNFLSSFQNNYKRNPFPSRAVVITVKITDIEQALQFLKKFGNFNRSLKVVVQIDRSRAFEILQLIWQILNCVPNLKYLLIEELPGNYNFPWLTDGDSFTNFLDLNDIPVLQQLKWIEMDVKSLEIQDVVTKALRNRSATIFEGMEYIKPCHLSSDWKNLNLQLNRQTTSREWRGHNRSFKLLNLPLESIDLQYSKCEDFESIFDSLSKYGTTLRRITLTFNSLEIQELVEMKTQVDAIYVSFLSQMRCLESFNMILDCSGAGRSIEFRQFVDQILDADWILKYSEMRGNVSGFRRFGFACISAGLQITAGGSGKLKRKYCTDGKYFRSMEVVSDEDK